MEGEAADSGKWHRGKKPAVYIPVLEDKREGDVCWEQQELLSRQMGEPRTARNRPKNAESLKWKLKDPVGHREAEEDGNPTGRPAVSTKLDPQDLSHTEPPTRWHIPPDMRPRRHAHQSKAWSGPSQGRYTYL